MDEWIKKMMYIYVYRNIIHKKKETLPFVTTQMDLGGIMLGEISQTERQIRYCLSYMQNPKKPLNSWI